MALDLLLIEKSDIIVECSGAPVYATSIVKEALLAKKPVITMDAELQIISGSYLGKLGTYFSEAEGDQPGCLAALGREAILMGFKPIVFGNIKGFLNLNPLERDMKYWSKKQGISIDQKQCNSILPESVCVSWMMYFIIRWGLDLRFLCSDISELQAALKAVLLCHASFESCKSQRPKFQGKGTTVNGCFKKGILYDIMMENKMHVKYMILSYKYYIRMERKPWGRKTSVLG